MHMTVHLYTTGIVEPIFLTSGSSVCKKCYDITRTANKRSKKTSKDRKNNFDEFGMPHLLLKRLLDNPNSEYPELKHASVLNIPSLSSVSDAQSPTPSYQEMTAVRIFDRHIQSYLKWRADQPKG